MATHVTKIKDLTGWAGNAALYRLFEPRVVSRPDCDIIGATRRIPDHASRNDHERKLADPKPPRYSTEAALRQAYRADVRYLHAEGFGRPHEYRHLREQHTASVRRERLSAASATLRGNTQ